LKTAGELTAGGETRAVTGSTWYDHEYSTALLEEDVQGWDWFGLQLDDGRDLMLFTLRHEDGTRAAAAGTLVARDGTATALDADAFTIVPTDRWTSPATRATYPARWTIALPDAGLSLDVRPLIPDAELDTAKTTGVTYWEGPVAFEGTASGRGYAELTGYAGTMGGKL
jgi:predicted secreted hydrolase